MLRIITVNLMLTLPILALAQSDVVPKIDGKCPTGYRDGQGAYCYGSKSRSSNAISKTDGKCPTGYRDGKGAYCYSGKSAPDVINKVGGKCPTGYRDGKGAYCYGK
ncbi:MAG: hypothetical protein R3E64_03485 [Halioglobus sp.]